MATRTIVRNFTSHVKMKNMLSQLSIKRAVNKAKRTNSIVTIRRDELGVIYVVYPNGKIDMRR